MTDEQRRAVKVPLHLLQEEAESLVDQLRNLLTKEFDEDNEDEINKISHDVSAIKNDFDNKSREIESRYRQAGSTHQSRSAKRLRLEIMREAYDFGKELNGCREKLNLGTISNRDPRYQESLVSVMTVAPHVQQHHVEELEVINVRPNQPISQVPPSEANYQHIDNSSYQRDNEVATPSSNSTNYLLKADLLKVPAKPFSGIPGTYHIWANILKERMRCITLTGIEQLQVLFTHTSGRPQELIDDYLSNVRPESSASALETIWATFEERYGNKMVGAQILIDRLKKLPSIQSVDDEDAITRMLDACRNALCSMNSSPQLQWLNSYEGIHMLTDKLSDSLCSRWRTYGIRIKTSSGQNPNLSVFIGFIQQLYKESVDDFFKKKPTPSRDQRPTRSTKVFRTEGIIQKNDQGNTAYCYVHNTDAHDLKVCRQFSKFDKEKKITVVKENKLCFRCLGKHFVTDCNVKVPNCNICQKNHLTIMHYNDEPKLTGANRVNNNNFDYGFAKVTRTQVDEVSSDESCVFSKTFSVEISHPSSNRIVKGIAILDDQSTRCFVDKKLLKVLDIDAPNHSYSVETLSGLSTNIEGQLLSGLKVRSSDNQKWCNLPDTLTSDMIPDTRHEMASPNVIRLLPHVRHLASRFREVRNDVEPVLLIGADAGELMKCISHGSKSPYVHQTPLGFALVGPVSKSILKKCKFNIPPPSLHSFRTSAKIAGETNIKASEIFPYNNSIVDFTKHNIFDRQADDELKGLSLSDTKFLDRVSSEVKIDEDNRVVLPLPFKEDDVVLPNNKDSVYFRTVTTLNKLKFDKDKLDQCLAAIDKNLQLGHVEQIPCDKLKPDEGKAWWLPVFSVTHPQKRTARLVFDASASYHKVSLNNALLQGPDLNNDLRAVLMRFRRHPVAFSCDIKHMFQNFIVPENQRNFLRFFWWEKNDPARPIVQYRSNVHLFGARSSPAIAEFGLKFIANREMVQGNATNQTAKFINTNFYVDDGLQSCRNIEEAVSTIEETKTVLGKYKLDLHKICSNSSAVEEHFSLPQGATISSSVPITQSSSSRTLGVVWDTVSDQMVVTVNIPQRPFTRRGLLSSVNGLFDPIGMVAPVVLGGRIIQREAMSKESNIDHDWDSPLPESMKNAWDKWKEDVKGVRLAIPRCLFASHQEHADLHVFADASSVAIEYVIYATCNSLERDEDIRSVSFVIAGSKVAPKSATTIPRLELCAALEASIAAANVVRQIDAKIGEVFCYTDSKIVLGYLQNSRRSFARYVSRRIDSITRICPSGSDWLYVSTSENPADHATRPTHPNSLTESNWFTGPNFLKSKAHVEREVPEVHHSSLPEAIPEHKVLRCSETTSVKSPLTLLADRLISWPKCIQIVRKLLSFTKRLSDSARQKSGKSLAPRNHDVSSQDAINALVLASQKELFPEAFNSSDSLSCLPDNHSLSGLSVFKDSSGLLRAGCRLRNALCSYEVKYPLILSAKHPISMRIALHCHEMCAHQGRILSYTALRNQGYFIIKGKRLVNQIISSCARCKRLRGPTAGQMMADLPVERVTDAAPFENVGIYVFGPFLVHDGVKTRRSSATKKMYGLLITCLASRAVHVEPLTGLDTVSFINGMRRFTAIRGQCKSILSDNGTNFVGALSSSIDFKKVERDALTRGCVWKMNPPGASHFGGAYERKIGSVRRVLEGFLTRNSSHNLSRDEMCTFLQEAVSIVNSTPLYGITENLHDPYPITPSMLLTLKVEPFSSSEDQFTSSDISSYGKNRWKKVQYIADEFWNNWHKFYLSGLVERRKWKVPKIPMRAGDVVFVKAKNLPRCQWNIGLVTDTVKSTDGLVRRAMVKVSPSKGRNRIVEKAIHDLVPLCSIGKTFSGRECAVPDYSKV